MPSEQEQGVEPVACPFCAGVAVRKPDPGVVYELFGLVVDHKPGCFLALAGAEPDAIVDAAWNTRTPTPDAVNADTAVAREGCVGAMTPERATYFLQRFKRDEKMLGPHEQWALDYAIEALATPAPNKALMPEAAVGERDIKAAADFMDEVRPYLGDCGMTNSIHLALRQALARHRTTPTPVEEPGDDWTCAARKQSLPEPADCNWPVCGCDPAANKVIQALEESGVAATNAGQVEAVSSIEVLREWFGGERYARDYEYLDANYGKQARQVADFLNSRAALSQAKETGK